MSYAGFRLGKDFQKYEIQRFENIRCAGWNMSSNREVVLIVMCKQLEVAVR